MTIKMGWIHYRSTMRSTGLRRVNRGGMLLGLFIGILLGLLCALGVVWYLHKTPLPFLDKEARPGAGTAAVPAMPVSPPEMPQSLPDKPGDKAAGNQVSEKPRFEFYKILPGAQDAVPNGAKSSAVTSGAIDVGVSPGTPSDVPPVVVEVFYLQAGAFQKAVDADNFKVRLALMGFETGVKEVSTPERGVMHRVRIGPYASAEEMNRARNQLAQGGIQATPLKIKETAPDSPSH